MSARRRDRSMDFVTCRTLGHQWDLVPSSWTPSFGTPFEARCERCDAIRRDIIDNRGAVSSRSYIYPDGYQGQYVMNRAALRLILLGRRP